MFLEIRIYFFYLLFYLSYRPVYSPLDQNIHLFPDAERLLEQPIRSLKNPFFLNNFSIATFSLFLEKTVVFNFWNLWKNPTDLESFDANRKIFFFCLWWENLSITTFSMVPSNFYTNSIVHCDISRFRSFSITTFHRSMRVFQCGSCDCSEDRRTSVSIVGFRCGSLNPSVNPLIPVWILRL